MSNFIDKH